LLHLGLDQLVKSEQMKSKRILKVFQNKEKIFEDEVNRIKGNLLKKNEKEYNQMKIITKKKLEAVINKINQ